MTYSCFADVFHALHLSLYSTLSIFKHYFYIRVGEIHVNNDLLFVCINRIVQLKVTYNIALKMWLC